MSDVSTEIDEEVTEEFPELPASALVSADEKTEEILHRCSRCPSSAGLHGVCPDDNDCGDVVLCQCCPSCRRACAQAVGVSALI